MTTASGFGPPFVECKLLSLSLACRGWRGWGTAGAGRAAGCAARAAAAAARRAHGRAGGRRRAALEAPGPRLEDSRANRASIRAQTTLPGPRAKHAGPETAPARTVWPRGRRDPRGCSALYRRAPRAAAGRGGARCGREAGRPAAATGMRRRARPRAARARRGTRLSRKAESARCSGSAAPALPRRRLGRSAGAAAGAWARTGGGSARASPPAPAASSPARPPPAAPPRSAAAVRQPPVRRDALPGVVRSRRGTRGAGPAAAERGPAARRISAAMAPAAAWLRERMQPWGALQPARRGGNRERPGRRRLGAPSPKQSDPGCAGWRQSALPPPPSPAPLTPSPRRRRAAGARALQLRYTST
jgi:hypothetical protein